MPKKPQRRPSPDILPDSLPPQRREEEPDVRREAPETPDSLPGETDPDTRQTARRMD